MQRLKSTIGGIVLNNVRLLIITLIMLIPTSSSAEWPLSEEPEFEIVTDEKQVCVYDGQFGSIKKPDRDNEPDRNGPEAIEIPWTDEEYEEVRAVLGYSILPEVSWSDLSRDAKNWTCGQYMKALDLLDVRSGSSFVNRCSTALACVRSVTDLFGSDLFYVCERGVSFVVNEMDELCL